VAEITGKAAELWKPQNDKDIAALNERQVNEAAIMPAQQQARRGWGMGR
jgi:hypothetical protein